MMRRKQRSWRISKEDSNQFAMAEKLKAVGGSGDSTWDDGSDHDGVAKIYVRGGPLGIEIIQLDYVKNGQLKGGECDGAMNKGFTQTFEIDYLNNEFLESVEVYHDASSNIMQGIKFKTNLRVSGRIGYDKGTKFSLAVEGKKIIGFYGCAEKNLNSLGAYVITLPLITFSECYGSSFQEIFKLWDDGGFDGIRKVSIRRDGLISCIALEYNKGNTVVERIHGRKSGGEEEFVLDYPNEFITSVVGSFKQITHTFMLLASVTFKTSKGRTTSTCQDSVVFSQQVRFVLESKGCAIVGFFGLKAGHGQISGLGAYYHPLPPPTGLEKLDAQGGDQGVFWEDGVFNGVRNIYVGRSENGVAYLKFVYHKNTEVVIGDDHGNKTLLEVKEFGIEYPSEYITAVEGCYDKIDGSEVEVITMLRFKTNKRTSIHVGAESNSRFLLYKEGYKIVGFHGKASNMIHQLGVYVMPITH